MVVAARAGDREAHERHRHVLGDVDRVLVQDVVVGRAVRQRVARRGQHLTRQRVPRLVGGDAGANPVVVRPHRVRLQAPARDEQQVRPFVGPVVDELRPFEQRIHQARALVGTGIGGERAHLGRRRQDPGGVEIGAPDEFRVRRQPGRLDVELAQLPQDRVVEIRARCIGVDRGIDARGKRRSDPRRHQAAQVPGRNRRLAGALHFHDALVADRGDRALVGGELRPARHVLGVAVGETGAHDQRLLVAELQARRRREDFQRGHHRVGLRRRGRAGGNPLREHAILRRPCAEPAAAAVRHRHRRLEQHQASRRFHWIDATRGGLARQRQVVRLGIVAAQRQLQPALAGERPVARSGVAADPGQYRHHVVAERQRIRRRRPLDLHHRRGAAVAVANRDERTAVAHGGDETLVVHRGDRRVRRGE